MITPSRGAVNLKPIGVAMNLGRVLPQLAPVRCQLVEELLMCIDVERIFRQRLRLALERAVLTHQLVVCCAQLRLMQLRSSAIPDQRSRHRAHRESSCRLGLDYGRF
jgi:hypothetical protein